MAMTQVGNRTVEMDPYVIDEVTVSALTSDLLESWVPASALVVTGKAKNRPFEVLFEIQTPPDSRCPLSMSVESYSTTTGTLRLRFYGGDLTGAVLKLRAKFNMASAGGISA